MKITIELYDKNEFEKRWPSLRHEDSECDVPWFTFTREYRSCGYDERCYDRREDTGKWVLRLNHHAHKLEHFAALRDILDRCEAHAAKHP